MGSAPTSLRVNEEFRRYFRTWDIMDVTVARMKYRQLTLRYCINMEQLAIVLGRQLPDPLVSFVFGLFAPKPIREPRSVPVVDAVEVFVGLILVCQATLAQRIAFIFDLMDSRGLGQLSESELSILLCAVARSVVKMTSPPYAVHPESMHKFALAGIAQEAQRVKSLDKITFCNWATKNPTFVSYIHICTGQDLPRLYIGLEKTNQLIGFIEFDSLTHMQSISAAGLRQLAQFYLISLPSDFEFLQQGRKVDKHNEPNVKAWNLIPFALLGTPGMSFHFKTVDYQKKAILTGITIDSGPHPNQRPHGSFQFQYHHLVVESYARSVHHIAPIHKHYHFRLKGDTVWWLPSQFWCGDWLLNQSRIASHSRHRLKSKLRKLNKVFSGTIVKDASGHILSHSSTLQAQQSKLRLLALNTQLEADDIKSEDKSVIIIDLENNRKQYHKRMLGTIKRKTAPIDTNWKVIDSRAVQPNAWSKSNSSIPLRADEIQAFPVVWIRPLENEESPMDEVDISRKDESVVFLIRTIIQSLGDKRIMNGQDVFGRTLLHHAAVYGQSRIVDVLLSEHALINIGDSQGNTPLHVAASRGRLKEVSALVAKGAVTTALNVHHQLPLLLALYHAARKRGTFKSNDVMTKYSTIEQVIDLLWDRTPPAWWHVPDIYNVTIFQMEQAIFGDIFEAARAGLVPRIQHLVESKKVSDINATMPELRRTALHEACERGRYNTCDYLVRSGADVFAQDIRGSTPLHVAAPRGFDKIVELLVHRYPKATLVQDINGKTALHLAIEHSHTNIALYLIQHTPEVNIADTFGYTPLHSACLLANVQIASELLNKGANPTTNQYTFPRPLHQRHLFGYYWKKQTVTTIRVESPMEMLLLGWSCDLSNSKYFELFKCLIQHNAWLHGSTDCTNQPLAHRLVSVLSPNPSYVVQCLRELSKAQVLSVNSLDQQGNTILLQECLRVSRGKDPSLAVVHCLLDLGADIHLANKANELPIQCAAYHGNNSLLEVLLDLVTPDLLCRSTQTADSPLHMASLGGHIDSIQLLLSRGALINACARESPLCFAVRSGKIEVVQYLLHRGAEVNIWRPLENSFVVFGNHYVLKDDTALMGSPLTLSLHLASRVFQLPTVDIAPAEPELLAKNQHIYLSKQELIHREKWQSWYRVASILCNKLLEIDSSFKIHVYPTDISLACSLGFWSIADQLLTQRRIPFPRICDDVDKMEAIHYAAGAGQTAIVAALVTNGVNPNVKVKHITHRFSKQHNRCTFFSVGPLYMSFSRGHLVTAAKLLLLGATVDSLPQIRAMILLNGGWNAWMKLNYLQQHKRSQQFTQHANMVRQLESATRTNLSIVHVACLRGTLELLKIYCLAGHSLHDVTPDGHTPLTLAIQAEHTDIVEWICDKHPQVLLVKAMHLPLVIACGLNPQSKKKHKIYNSLLSRGISISDVGADGLSALDKAAYVADNAIFELLVEAKAKPRVSTIIAALQGRNESIIQQLVSIVSSIDGATFDHLLQIFILASSQRQWLLLEHILTLPDAFIDPISTWIRRAASCCLFLHRAAAANQTKIVRLLLAKGVPADLVVAEIPHTRSPIWYATIYGALDSFLALVLHLSPQHLILSAVNCEVPWKLNCLQLPLHSIDTTDVVRVTGFETCTWRNISTMSCYQSARTRSLRFIHRCIQYWIAHSLVQPRNEDNQTLLHLAAKAGDEQTLRVIVEAGGKLETFNNHMQSPAMLTAQRGDASGTKMLQYIWPLLSDDHKVLVCQACTQSPQINLSSLRFCLQESKFFKGMHYAPSILSGQAAAIELLIAAKIPIEYTVWQNLSIVLQSKQAKRCGQIVQSLLPVLDTSVKTEIVADIAAAAAKFQWWPILSHLLQLFGACLVKSLCHVKEGYSQSILHEAVVAGEHQIIQYLLQQGGDIQIDSKGQSPLHYIAWIGDLSLFHLFKRYLPSDRFLQVLNHQDSLGRTACHIAAMRGHLDLFDSLLSTGANNDIRTKEGNTPVLVAAKHNQQHIVMRLVLQKPPASSLETLHQESIVIVAAKYGAFRIVSWLLLTLNLPSSTVIGLVCKEGKTITHYAALHNELSTLTTHSYLLQTINAKDSYGCTPLHYALMHGQLEVIQYLCWNGANVFGPIQNLIPNNEMFDVAMLFEWSPLPGWFAHLMRANANSKIQKNRNTDFRRGLRCWSFPKTSLLEFATATGCLHTVSYIMSVLRYLPQLCQGTPDVRQRIFMTAVTQNRVDVVDVMLASDVKQVVEDSGDISQTQVQYFGDFVLTALNHSSRRGLEAMTLCLLRHEKEVVPNEAITPGIPNNQSQSDSICHSAKLLQYSCIYGHLDLIRELVRRSGSAILNFHSDDGPAIIYAIAFGHIDAVRVLMQAGAEISSLNSIHVPSMKRWHEFRRILLVWPPPFHYLFVEPATPQPSWPFYQPQKAKRRRRSFRGPIEKYEVVERLPREMLAHITSSSQFTA